MIDFHSQFSTIGSTLPEQDGSYYQSFKTPIETAEWVNDFFVETVDIVAERMRSLAFQRGYEQMMPVLYSEFIKRIIATTPNRLMMEMAKYNVRQSVVCGLDPYIPTSEVVEACEKTKGILIPFGSVDPQSNNWRETLDHVLSQRIAGFNIHYALQNTPLGSPVIREIIKKIAEKRPRMPIYIHAGEFPIFKTIDTNWEKSLTLLASEFSEQPFICGHSGWNKPSSSLRAALRNPNILLETSWQPAEVIRRLCLALGPSRLILGSDYPLYSMRRAIGNCRRALSPKEFIMVTSTNAKALIGGS
jgi:predicted TIM-barrel fold metal-dependent hydrolase